MKVLLSILELLDEDGEDRQTYGEAKRNVLPFSIRRRPKNCILLKKTYLCLICRRWAGIEYSRLDGPGIESRWRRHLPYPSRPSLQLTQLLVPCVLGHFLGKVTGEWS